MSKVIESRPTVPALLKTKRENHEKSVETSIQSCGKKQISTEIEPKYKLYQGIDWFLSKSDDINWFVLKSAHIDRFAF